MKTQREKDIEIINALIKQSDGKLCSRYVLGLERARDSIKDGSADKALRQQREWLRNLRKK